MITEHSFVGINNLKNDRPELLISGAPGGTLDADNLVFRGINRDRLGFILTFALWGVGVDDADVATATGKRIDAVDASSLNRFRHTLLLFSNRLAGRHKPAAERERFTDYQKLHVSLLMEPLKASIGFLRTKPPPGRLS